MERCYTAVNYFCLIRGLSGFRTHRAKTVKHVQGLGIWSLELQRCGLWGAEWRTQPFQGHWLTLPQVWSIYESVRGLQDSDRTDLTEVEESW